MKSALLSRLISYVAQCHAGQVDKSGEPYILHCLYVLNQVLEKHPKNYELACVALCHDLIEDTSATYGDLSSAGLTEDAIFAIKCLTKVPNQTPTEYFEELRKSRLAMLVKLEDIKHNCQILRLSDITEKDFSRLKKYMILYNKIKEELK